LYTQTQRGEERKTCRKIHTKKKDRMGKGRKTTTIEKLIFRYDKADTLEHSEREDRDKVGR